MFVLSDTGDSFAVLVAVIFVTMLYSVSGVSPVNVPDVCQVFPPSMEYSCPLTALTVIVVSVLLSSTGA